MPSPAISVVVPSARATPDRLLAALADQLQPDDELILVRNRRQGGEGRWVGVEGVRDQDVAGGQTSRLTTLESPTGAAEARNAGWQAAERDWILFLDDDIEVNASFVDAVRDAARQAPLSLGIISFRVAATPGPRTDLVEATITLDRGPDTRCTDGQQLDLSETWLFGVGAALLVRRELLVETEGFKARLGAGVRNGGSEDLEFLWHASRHTQIRYRGDIAVLHGFATGWHPIGRKLRQYGRAIGALSSAVPGQEGARLVGGYNRYLAGAAFQIGRIEGLRAHQRWGLRLQIVLALGATLRVFLLGLLVRQKAAVACALCESR